MNIEASGVKCCFSKYNICHNFFMKFVLVHSQIFYILFQAKMILQRSIKILHIGEVAQQQFLKSFFRINFSNQILRFDGM